MNVGDQVALRGALLMMVGVLVFGLAACERESVQSSGKDAASPIVKSEGVEKTTNIDGSEKVGLTVDDLSLNVKVEDALKESTELKSLPIKVRIANGVVTLSGNVTNTALRDRATQVVMNVDGVKSVQNQLAVADG